MKLHRVLIPILFAVCTLHVASPYTVLADGPTYWPGGALTQSTTWTVPHSPYVVQAGEVTVPAGMTLTVEAGVVVKSFNDGITVNGALIAAGSEISPVVFTSLYDDAYGGDTDGGGPASAPGQWYSLYAPSGGRIRLDHAIVRYGGASSNGSVGTNGGSLEVSSSLVEQSCYFGMQVYANSFVLRDSTISGTARCDGPLRLRHRLGDVGRLGAGDHQHAVHQQHRHRHGGDVRRRRPGHHALHRQLGDGQRVGRGHRQRRDHPGDVRGRLACWWIPASPTPARTAS